MAFPTSKFALVSPTKLPYELVTTLHAFLMAAFVDLKRVLDDGVGGAARPGAQKWHLVCVFTDALDGTSSLRRLCKEITGQPSASAASVVYRSRFPHLRLESYTGADGVGKSFAIVGSMDQDTATGRLVIPVRVSEPFSVDAAVDRLASVADVGAGGPGAARASTFAEAVASSVPVTLVFFVSAYAPLDVFDAFLFDLCVLGVVTSRASGAVLALPSEVDLRVVVEVPNPTTPIPDHAGQGPARTQVRSTAAGNMLREGTAREVRQRQAHATQVVRRAAVCPCEVCVGAVPGYEPRQGCANMVHTLRCVDVAQRHIDDTTPFVVPVQDVEGSPKVGVQLAFRVLKAYFTPLPSSWTDRNRHRVNAPGRVLADATIDLNDRPPGLAFHNVQLASTHAQDRGVSEALTYDGESVLDGLMTDDEVVRRLQVALMHRDDLRDIFTNKRQLTFFLGHVARAVAYWKEVYSRLYNERDLCVQESAPSIVIDLLTLLTAHTTTSQPFLSLSEPCSNLVTGTLHCYRSLALAHFLSAVALVPFQVPLLHRLGHHAGALCGPL